MHHSRVSWTELNRADVTRLLDRNARHEVAIHVFAACGQLIRRKADDQIRCAELPLVLPLRGGRQVRWVALDGPFVDPPSYEVDPVVTQPTLIGKCSIPGFGQPGWHSALLDRGGDQRGAILDVPIRQQAERRRPTGSMTRCTVPEHERSHIFGEREWTVPHRKRWGMWAGRACCTHHHGQHRACSGRKSDSQARE
jgi:hypothetical protein